MTTETTERPVLAWKSMQECIQCGRIVVAWFAPTDEVALYVCIYCTAFPLPAPGEDEDPDAGLSNSVWRQS